MTLLSVNLNKVALLRNARDRGIPSLTRMAGICIEAGCGGITVHPRPDQRHTRPGDVQTLATLVDEGGEVEFNVEGNPFEEPRDNGYPGYMEMVREAEPHQCTLVPDDPGQLTSDHGWNFDEDAERLEPIVSELRAMGSRVSVFVDPQIRRIEQAAELGVDRIELYTGPYAEAFESGDFDDVLARYVEAAELADELGLGVNAGHDLDLENLPTFSTRVAPLAEVSIGHALISDAIRFGLADTVRAYLAALDEHRSGEPSPHQIAEDF
jgi:pyridoxine 5-phosphate synthase